MRCGIKTIVWVCSLVFYVSANAQTTAPPSITPNNGTYVGNLHSYYMATSAVNLVEVGVAAGIALELSRYQADGESDKKTLKIGCMMTGAAASIAAIPSILMAINPSKTSVTQVALALAKVLQTMVSMRAAVISTRVPLTKLSWLLAIGILGGYLNYSEFMSLDNGGAIACLIDSTALRWLPILYYGYGVYNRIEQARLFANGATQMHPIPSALTVVIPIAPPMSPVLEEGGEQMQPSMQV